MLDDSRDALIDTLMTLSCGAAVCILVGLWLLRRVKTRASAPKKRYSKLLSERLCRRRSGATEKPACKTRAFDGLKRP